MTINKEMYDLLKASDQMDFATSKSIMEFAELIIEKCASTAFINSSPYIGWKIKEQFGIDTPRAQADL